MRLFASKTFKLGLMVLAILGGCSKKPELDKGATIKVLKSVASPDNKFTIEITSSDAGATTTPVYGMTVVDNRTKDVLGLLHNENMVACEFGFSWTGNNQLNISVPEYYQSVISQISEWHGIGIEYSYKKPPILKQVVSPDKKHRAVLYDFSCYGGLAILIRGIEEKIGNPTMNPPGNPNGLNAHVGWVDKGTKIDFKWVGPNKVKILCNVPTDKVIAKRDLYEGVKIEWAAK